MSSRTVDELTSFCTQHLWGRGGVRQTAIRAVSAMAPFSPTYMRLDGAHTGYRGERLQPREDHEFVSLAQSQDGGGGQ